MPDPFDLSDLLAALPVVDPPSSKQQEIHKPACDGALFAQDPNQQKNLSQEDKINQEEEPTLDEMWEEMFTTLFDLRAPFLQLPPEIRSHIYEFALGGHTFYTRRSGCIVPPDFRALLSVNHQIHAESRLLPFKMNEFNFDSCKIDDILNFASSLSVEQRESIRHVKVGPEVTGFWVGVPGSQQGPSVNRLRAEPEATEVWTDEPYRRNSNLPALEWTFEPLTKLFPGMKT